MKPQVILAPLVMLVHGKHGHNAGRVESSPYEFLSFAPTHIFKFQLIQYPRDPVSF
jgi:hypothetical protein